MKTSKTQIPNFFNYWIIFSMCLDCVGDENFLCFAKKNGESHGTVYVLFYTIYELHYTISTNFYIYLQYF